jgi:YVTN family beta-propeller protein
VKIKTKLSNCRIVSIAAMVLVVTASTRLNADTGSCGGVTTTVPFTDVMGSPFFCQIAEAFFSGLTNGTTGTTYSPSQPVLREQMAAFVTRTLDQSLRRGSRRSMLDQYWTPASADGLGLTNVGSSPQHVASDGADLWVTTGNADTVIRVRASDGKLLETWTGASAAFNVLVARSLIFVTSFSGNLYRIDPTQTAGAVTTLTTTPGGWSPGIAFDGARIWTSSVGGSVSIVTLNPFSVSTVTAGFTQLAGMVYDGANTWVVDYGASPGKLFKLDSNGSIIQTVNVGDTPFHPVFDGTNIWVPNFGSNTVAVVRASTAAVIATLTGNGLSGPNRAAFDGERILVTNEGAGQGLSLWEATDLTPLGFVTLPNTDPRGVCSDGLNFWITLNISGKLARF